MIRNFTFLLNTEKMAEAPSPVSLMQVLNDPYLCQLFQEYLEERHCEESLLFLVDAEIFRRIGSLEEQRAKAEQMIENYFLPQSLRELNIGDESLRRQRALFDSVKDDFFTEDGRQTTSSLWDTSQAQTRLLLAQQHHPEFIKSDMFVNYARKEGLRSIPLYSVFPPEKAWGSLSSLSTYSRHEAVVFAGEYHRLLFLIEKGSIRVERRNQRKLHLSLPCACFSLISHSCDVLHKNDVFGEDQLFLSGPSPCTYFALEDQTSVRKISVDELLASCSHNRLGCSIYVRVPSKLDSGEQRSSSIDSWPTSPPIGSFLHWRTSLRRSLSKQIEWVK
jgi:CRP-like cAMP-binding protein